MSNLSNFADLIKQANEEKRIRELKESERKEKEVAPLLSELFASVSKAKEAKQERNAIEEPLLKELQSALSDPVKFRSENQEKKNKIVELVTELENKASVIQNKIVEPDKDSKSSVTDLEKKFLKLFNRLQNDFQTLKKYVDSRPVSSGVYGSTSGSGEVRILRMDDIEKNITPVDGDVLVWSSTLNKFTLSPQTGGNGGTTTIYSDEDMPFAKRVDFISDNEIYKGEAVVGASETSEQWRIRKVIISSDNDVSETWANGTALYNKAWSDRLTYTYI